MTFQSCEGVPLNPVVSKGRVEYDSAESSSCSDQDAAPLEASPNRRLKRLSSEQAIDEYMSMSAEPAEDQYVYNMSPENADDEEAIVPYVQPSTSSGSNRHLTRMSSDEAVQAFFSGV